ncbi:hypothetical protein ACLOJK_002923 [Asimina triloba]
MAGIGGGLLPPFSYLPGVEATVQSRPNVSEAREEDAEILLSSASRRLNQVVGLCILRPHHPLEPPPEVLEPAGILPFLRKNALGASRHRPHHLQQPGVLFGHAPPGRVPNPPPTAVYGECSSREERRLRMLAAAGGAGGLKGDAGEAASELDGEVKGVEGEVEEEHGGGGGVLLEAEAYFSRGAPRWTDDGERHDGVGQLELLADEGEVTIAGGEAAGVEEEARDRTEERPPSWQMPPAIGRRRDHQVGRCLPRSTTDVTSVQASCIPERETSVRQLAMRLAI